METLIIEGTIEEVRKKLNTLPIPPKQRIRVEVTDSLEIGHTIPHPQAERHNGLILVPTRNPDLSVTTELVKELLNSE